MKRLIYVALAAVALAAMVGATFAPKPAPEADKVNWVSIEEAVALAAQDEKKILVDMYTDWCGWCKRMDATTYKNPEVVAYINAHYHAVKFNAEQKEDVTVGGVTYKFRADAGRRGAHELAIQMLNGRLSYPSTVFFTYDLQMLTNVPGYQKAKEMETILAYLAQDAYKTTPWQEFQEEYSDTGK